MPTLCDLLQLDESIRLAIGGWTERVGGDSSSTQAKSRSHSMTVHYDGQREAAQINGKLSLCRVLAEALKSQTDVT